MKISVIIPVKNGAGTLEKCLASIRSQTIKDIEIIILDSMSVDESRSIASNYDAKLIEVKDGEFNHGLTRNIGVNNASGDLIFLTVQDAWLSENNLLERMSSHFSDGIVKAVVGHQAVPHEQDKNPVQWFKPYTEPEILTRHYNDPLFLANIPSKELSQYIAWDDVVAMYTKDSLMELPFLETDFAEDWLWSFAALNKGWKLVYDPSLVVYHYHHRDFQYAFKVTYTVNYHFYTHFDIFPVNGSWLKKNILAVYRITTNDKLNLKEKFFWSWYNMSSNTGDFLSTVHFKLTYFLRGKAGIKRAYLFFCSQVPQGKSK